MMIPVLLLALQADLSAVKKKGLPNKKTDSNLNSQAICHLNRNMLDNNHFSPTGFH